MLKKMLSSVLCVTVVLGVGLGSVETQQARIFPQSVQVVNADTMGKAPKYVFMFIGDGMSHVQVNAAQVYEGNNTYGEVDTRDLNFSKFPVAGYATTHDSTSFAPDSASTATSLSSGIKTHSGVIGLGADKTTKPKNITELLKEQKEMKIGVVSTVTLNHATPAAYYAHVPSRGNYYDIAMQMADSDIDYFGGGSLSQPTGKDKNQKDAYEVLKEKGYRIANTKEDILKLDNKSGKAYAISPVLQDSGSMPYTLDNKDSDLTLADFVKKGIDVLDNKNGFFLMTESGKIDWAGHANDAKSNISDVLALEDSVQVAVDFAKKHPEDTLIIVTGDHETGGMTIGYAATGYGTAFNILDHQKMSYVAFDELIINMKKENPNMTFKEVMPIITKNFGLILPNSKEASIEKNKALVLSELELKKLRKGFAESMKDKEKCTKDEETDLLYGGYNPLSVSLTHILNNKAGIGWTSYSHTGTPVPVYAYGQGAEIFNGSYDNTDLFHRLTKITKIKSK